MAQPVLQIIIGSTRPGRVGPAVAAWIIDRARARGDFEVVVTDLAELNLPMFDEPNHPRLHQYVHQHTKDWSAIVEASDAFIFVIPEYNYGFNAATKNAIDYLNSEWLNKPAGIVSYGAVAAGTRAAQMLKQVLSALKSRAGPRLGEHSVHPREARRGRPAEAERDHGTGRRRDARRAGPLGAGPAPAARWPYDTVTETVG